MEERAKAGTEKGKKERARRGFETVLRFLHKPKKKGSKKREIHKPCDSQKLYYIQSNQKLFCEK
jgi:hypothetical protein